MGQKIYCHLKNFMDSEGLNISQLSRVIGVTENTIRGYAKNSFSRIDCEVAIKICSHFKTDFGSMFEIVGDMSNTFEN
jgi:plasmid maintenance system antidote protein VapI